LLVEQFVLFCFYHCGHSLFFAALGIEPWV
jgi:hypothetical protein